MSKNDVSETLVEACGRKTNDPAWRVVFEIRNASGMAEQMVREGASPLDLMKAELRVADQIIRYLDDTARQAAEELESIEVQLAKACGNHPYEAYEDG